MKEKLIAPSVLSSNFLRLEEEIIMINKSEATLIHIDIMDGLFVPNISFGSDICKKIHSIAKKPLDVHLMIVQPERYINQFIDAGASSLAIHIEATHNAHRTLTEIKAKGIKVGIAINPQTPNIMIEHLLPILDQIVVMGVNPGFGGQALIPETHLKIKKLRENINQRALDIKIIVDGGVNLQNANQLIEDGGDILVAGSVVFKSENPSKTISQLKHS